MKNNVKILLLVVVTSLVMTSISTIICINYATKINDNCSINTNEDIKYNNTILELADEIMPLFNSGDVNYDNTESGIQSDNVKGAIDELYACASDYSAYDTRLGNVESNKSDKAATVSTVGWDSTNKKLTKTINGTTTDIVTGENLLANSGVTAGSYGPSANATPGYGSTFNVPYITVNAKGQVTAASTKTVTIPASDNTNTTYSAASGGGLSLSSNAFSIANSGATAGSYGNSSNQTPGYGSTVNVPYITVNAKGQVTAISNKTVKIPASDNTNTWRGIQDNLTSTSTTDSLSAKQGKVLNEKIPIFTKIYENGSVTHSAGNTWKYTGKSITIPAYTAFALDIEQVYNNIYPNGVALYVSSSSFDENLAYPHNARHCAANGVTAESATTLYVWAKASGAGQNNILIRGSFIKMP